MLRMKLLKDCCTKGFYKMSKYRVDFHIHTKFSDGQASPAEIVDAAKALGYHQIAITDHDGIDGLPEALEEGRRVDLTVIPGMELATETASGTELHILGYGMDLADKTLLSAMKELSRRRAARNTKLIAALQEMGYDIFEEELRKIQPNDYIGKPVIARALIAKGYSSCYQKRETVSIRCCKADTGIRRTSGAGTSDPGKKDRNTGKPGVLSEYGRDR